MNMIIESCHLPVVTFPDTEVKKIKKIQLRITGNVTK